MSDHLSVNELLEKAEQANLVGDINGSLQYWRAILARESTPELLCQYGRIAVKAGYEEEAERAFLLAVELSPQIGLPYECLGLLYLERDSPELAEGYLKKSLEFEESARSYTLLGVSLFRQSDFQAARAAFNKALRIEPSYEEAYYNLALTFRDEQPNEAVRLLERAIDIDPAYAAAHRELGWCQRRFMNLPEALYHLKRAVELNQSDGWSYIYLGNTLWTINDMASAEEAFRKAIEAWPEDSIGYWCLALFYEYQGKLDEAGNLYQIGLEIDPSDIESNLYFGIFLNQIGEDQRARVHLRRVLSADPNNKRAKFFMSESE